MGSGTQPWSSLRRGRRIRLRSKLIRMKWRLEAKLGRCGHHGQIGPAGGSEGVCLICGDIIDWDE